MKPDQILSNKELSITSSRINILDVLLQSNVALSEKEIRIKLTDICDRATIYRTLKLFNKKGLVHHIPSENNTSKYVIQKKPENHLHFKCLTCNQITCLTGVRVSGYQLPIGYIQNEANFLISGTCNKCNL